MSPPAYHSYGGSVYQPDGEPYIQLQAILLGKTTWSVGFQEFIKALLKAFNGQLKTDATRKAIRDLMGEAYKTLSLRTITNWLIKARDVLQMIERERKETSNIWETTFAKPFLARLEKPAEPTTEPRSGHAEVIPAPIQNENLTSEQMARKIVQAARTEGWDIVLEGDDALRWNKLRSNANDAPDPDVVRLAKQYRDPIIELLKAQRRLE
jgi:hypothetical protein